MKINRQESITPVIISLLVLTFTLSGCVVRTYTVTKERPDQDLSSGNLGFLQGKPSGEPKERKTTRDTTTVEIELRPIIKFEGKSQPKSAQKTVVQEPEAIGNEGYITKTQASEIKEAGEPIKEIQKYKVLEGDTLQKIAQKFYGTTKNWTVIYNANKATLKGPDKIYPGQTINIPVLAPQAKGGSEVLKDTGENLK